MRQKWAPLALWAVLLGVGPLTAAADTPQAPSRRLGGPLAFERNQGQSAQPVHFLARGEGYGLFLTGEGATLALRAPDGSADVVRFRLVGGPPLADLSGESPMAGRVNYFIGNDPARWHRGISLFARVRHREVYPGVDLVYHGKDRQLEYDFELAPGADPGLVRLRIEGAEGVERQEDGRLRIITPHGEIVQLPPFAYQEKDGRREEVSARFRVEGKDVAFEVGAYDRSRPLVIDPIAIVWSRFLGEKNGDSVEALKADDRDGTTYVTGGTFSPGFPDTSGKLSYVAAQDVFVTKLSTSGGILYSAVFGGDKDEEGLGIDVDQEGNAYVTGRTASADYPINIGGPYRGGPSDAFVTKLQPTGDDILISTYLGGDRTDIGHDLALRGNDEPCVAGETDSDNFPQFNTPLVRGLFFDGFVTCLRNNLGGPVYSTYLGGKDEDRAFGIVVTGADAHVVGETASADFPVQNPLSGPKGLFDAFVSQIDTPSGALLFSTYLGGGQDDHATDVAVDGSGTYITGRTFSGDFPAVNAYQGFAGPVDAFATKLRRGGAAIEYSTFLGGTKDDSGSGITVGPGGFAYVTGATQSPDFPVRNPLRPPPAGADGDKLQGARDAFVAKIVPTGCSVDFSTYLGGELEDRGNDIGLHLFGDPPGLVVAGTTESTGFPVTMPPPYGIPPDDGFVVLITQSETADLKLSKSSLPASVAQGGTVTYELIVDNIGDVPTYNTVLTDTLPAGTVFQSATPGCTLSGTTVTCDLGCVEPGPTTIQIVVTVTAGPGIITNNAVVTTPRPEVSTANNSASAQTTVLASADLRIAKVAPATALVGAPILYQITVDNLGASASSGVVVTDTLPSGVIFDSAPGCTHLAGVVTCNIGTINALANAVRNITVHADFPGLVTNSVSVTATTPDPVSTNNSTTAQTLVVVPGETARFFTVRSRGGSGAGSGENLLEWLNPPGPAVDLHIHRTIAVGDICNYETSGSNLLTRIASPGFVANQYDRFPDSGLNPGTTYCYTLFVEQVPGTFHARFNHGRPFDATLSAPQGNVRWATSFGAFATASPGSGPGTVQVVLNDHALYTIDKADGDWADAPAGPNGPKFIPVGFMKKPSQGRPGVYPFSVGPAPRAIFLTSLDGKVYALNAEMGEPGPTPWATTLTLSVDAAIAAPSAIFTVFGGSRDLVFVGSRETPPTKSLFFALQLGNGSSAAPGWVADGGGIGNFGPVNGQAAVDYGPPAPPRVYFGTRQLSGVNNKTLWCVNIETGIPCWGLAHGEIDTAVTLRGDRLYVANNAGQVKAVDKMTGSNLWGAPFTIPGGEGPAKGFIMAPPGAANHVLFSTASRVRSLTDTGGGFFENWPGGIGLNAPSTPVLAAGDTVVYVGTAPSGPGVPDACLWQRATTTGAGVHCFGLGDRKAAVGSPTLDIRNRFVYVLTEDGILYAIQLP